MSAYESSLAPSCAGGGFFLLFYRSLALIKTKYPPQDASDALSYTLDKDYTNIEVYLNSLLKKNL